MATPAWLDRKSTRLNSSHEWISYAVFCLKKNKALGEGIEHLGRDDGVAYVALLQPGTDHPLGGPTAVTVRGVKVVDTRVPGVVHQGEGCLLVLSLPEKLRGRANPSESPAAESQHRDAHPGAPQRAVIHSASAEMVKVLSLLSSASHAGAASRAPASGARHRTPCHRWGDHPVAGRPRARRGASDGLPVGRRPGLGDRPRPRRRGGSPLCCRG